MDEQKIRDEIKTLEAELKEKKTKLFNARLLKLLEMTEEQVKDFGVENIAINMGTEEWNITYNHHTDNYTENNYIHDDGSEIEFDPVKRKFTIQFGKNKKYYIKGNGNNRFTIYRNGLKKLRVSSSQYSVELDLDEHAKLIENYSNNPDIPEWLALKIFIYMSKDNWSDENIIIYLSSV